MGEVLHIVHASSVLKNQANQKREEAKFLRVMATKLVQNADELEAHALDLESSANQMEVLARSEALVEVHEHDSGV